MKRTITCIQVLLAFLTITVFALVVPAQESETRNSTVDDQAAIRENVKQMEAGWNTKSGALFAKPFAADADYVVVNGSHIQGRPAVERGHQQIFDTVYKNTTLNLSVKQIRFLKPDVALVHVLGRTRTPEGDGFRESEVIISMIMLKVSEGWRITAFHNTRIDNPQRR